MVTIIILVAGTAAPSFMRNIKGARLRATLRNVITLNRYARRCAILKQQQVVLIYYTDRAEIELVMLGERSSGNAFERLDSRFSGRSMETALEEPSASGVKSKLTRRLDEGVAIEAFESKALDQQEGDTFWIHYYPNGICDGHSFVLRDRRDKTVEVEIQHINGDISVDF